jgi:hypothetical protein
MILIGYNNMAEGERFEPQVDLRLRQFSSPQIEQGNRDQAQYHLSRIAAICGTDCEEYRSLAAALEKPPGIGLVY